MVDYSVYFDIFKKKFPYLAKMFKFHILKIDRIEKENNIYMIFLKYLFYLFHNEITEELEYYDTKLKQIYHYDSIPELCRGQIYDFIESNISISNLYCYFYLNDSSILVKDIFKLNNTIILSDYMCYFTETSDKLKEIINKYDSSLLELDTYDIKIEDDNLIVIIDDYIFNIKYEFDFKKFKLYDQFTSTFYETDKIFIQSKIGICNEILKYISESLMKHDKKDISDIIKFELEI